MNLLKAIGKTTLSVLKWLLMILVFIGVISGVVFIGQHSAIATIVGNIILGVLIGILILLIVLIIVMDIKDNYEKYAKKSQNPENTYRINYNIIYKKDKVIKGKTKGQAIDHFYYEISKEDKKELDYDYKIIKIKEITY